jgi:hypothetical protein
VSLFGRRMSRTNLQILLFTEIYLRCGGCVRADPYYYPAFAQECQTESNHSSQGSRTLSKKRPSSRALLGARPRLGPHYFCLF